MKTKRIIFLAILTAVGIVLGLFESMIPIPVPIPGAKLGLSNIVVLVSIVLLGSREGFVISILKTIILMLLTGSVTSFFFSLGGAIFSSLTMIIMYRFFRKIFSLIGISLMGSFMHNLGQIFVASIMLNTSSLIVYFPLLAFIGIFTGFFVGISSEFVTCNLKRIDFN